MTPRTLNEWTNEKLVELLDKGVFEPELFDFKAIRLGKKSEQEKQDIRKDCCAFANTNGGFLVYGIHDDKRRPTRDRLLGIDKSFDFPKEFGAFPADCKPSIGWDFLNPPIDIDGGKVVHIIYIPRSWRGPHCIATERPQEGFVFPKRTNKGNEYMNYEEVRMAFLGYYEKRIKLNLLRSELNNIISDAHTLMSIPDNQNSDRYPTNSFNIAVIESVLIDTYTILQENAELPGALLALRNATRNLNTQLSMFYGIIHFPMTGVNQMCAAHNRMLRERCPPIIRDAERALELLQTLLS